MLQLLSSLVWPLRGLINLDIQLSRITEYMCYGYFKQPVNNLSHKYEIHKFQRMTTYKHKSGHGKCPHLYALHSVAPRRGIWGGCTWHLHFPWYIFLCHFNTLPLVHTVLMPFISEQKLIEFFVSLGCTSWWFQLSSAVNCQWIVYDDHIYVLW